MKRADVNPGTWVGAVLASSLVLLASPHLHAQEPLPASFPAPTLDAELARRVEQQLWQEPAWSCASVHVTAERGVVTLRGHVVSTEARTQLVHAAEQVDGVLLVDNNVEVISQQQWDRQVREKVMEHLQSIPCKPRVRIDVNNGVVMVSGLVDNAMQQAAVLHAIRSTQGVQRVRSAFILTQDGRAADIPTDPQLESAVRVPTCTECTP